MAAKLSILVVAGNARHRETFVDLLRLDGHDVIGAADRRTALESAARKPFDVVVSDASAGLPGPELRRLVRNQAGAPSQHVVLIDAAPVADIQQHPSAPAFYLTKPFHPDALSQLVAQCADALDVRAA